MPRKDQFIDQVENAIGRKVYQMRVENGWSRELLAEKIGVTHQQVQKYEKGSNRITAGRLACVAQAFRISPLVFFDGFSSLDQGNPNEDARGQRAYLEIIKNVKKITKPEHIVVIKNLVKSLVNG